MVEYDQQLPKKNLLGVPRGRRRTTNFLISTPTPPPPAKKKKQAVVFSAGRKQNQQQQLRKTKLGPSKFFILMNFFSSMRICT
jgi:hypothetical protein